MQGTGHIAHSGEEILKHGRQIKQMSKHGRHHSLGQALTVEVAIAIAITREGLLHAGEGTCRKQNKQSAGFSDHPAIYISSESHGAFFNGYGANGHEAFINGYGAIGHRQ
ncbi:hypothetical protein SUGI_0632120 [Cryptomeria japonica]|nr:hypothetical protein SUGI_0632120 [Cryptomeria japonica]